MATPKSFDVSADTGATATFQSSDGIKRSSAVRRLTRDSVVFEIHEPEVVFSVSELLSEFTITSRGEDLYRGRSVVRRIIDSGLSKICEATLEDGWVDAERHLTETGTAALSGDFQRFVRMVDGKCVINPRFKLAVADLQTNLLELKNWLDRVELGLRSDPRTRLADEKTDGLVDLSERISTWLSGGFKRFEEACKEIDSEQVPAYSAYVKRNLHPLVLCSPFMYRTYRKPLGYAGDYEMVNMMTREPFEGSSLFSKLLNSYFLSTAPVAAHRNRIEYLEGHLIREALRASARGGRFKVLSLGCGPAREIQLFLEKSVLSSNAQFTLLDFNDETVLHVRSVLEQYRSKCSRHAEVSVIKKSVAQFIKESGKARLGGKSFDLIYCAGLFDYLPDPVCTTLLQLLNQLLAPEGLLLATNVDPSNPCRGWMELAVDWRLIYRNHRELAALQSSETANEDYQVRSEMTGVNISLEIRHRSNVAIK